MVRNPFDIQGPAVISFSGGRTSGYLLRRILDAGLQPDVVVVFADTGREMPETYEFVRQVAFRWGVSIRRVERPGGFEQLITDKGMVPNSLARFCTTELKMKPIWALGRSLGFEHWTSVIGIRADEPRRVAKIKGRKVMEFEEVCLPLAEAGVTLTEVSEFWKAQPFDLRLKPHESNCDLCFLKGQGKRLAIMQDRPGLAEWWIEQERRMGGTFRAPPRPNYEQLLQLASHPRLFDPDEEEGLADCICGD